MIFVAKKIVGIFCLIIATYLTFMMMMADLPWNTIEPWYLAALVLTLVVAALVFLGAFDKNSLDGDDHDGPD